MNRPQGLRPFNRSGYEILDGRLASHGELVIWSNQAPTPELGDAFTVAPRGAIVDLVVTEITLVDGGWVASCRRAHPTIANPTAKAAS